jgi:hypothetical protein
MSDAMGAVDLPAPAIMKPMELWTGKQVGYGGVATYRDLKLLPAQDTTAVFMHSG